MASISKMINKVSKALNAKGMMPLINQEQFYGDKGPVTKYIIHYGTPKGKSNDVVDTVYVSLTCLKC